jgi:hypothetical protein
MSTKKVTTEQKDITQTDLATESLRGQQRLAFDPMSQAIYQSLLPAGTAVLQQYLTDPMRAAYTMLGVAQAHRMLGQMGATQAATAMQNLRQMGMAGHVLQPMLTQQLSNIALQTQSQKAQALLDALQQAAALQRAAGGAAMAYTPLQIGQDTLSDALRQAQMQQHTAGRTEEKVAGLGTWLPQLLGIGIPFGLGALGLPQSIAGDIFGQTGQGWAGVGQWLRNRITGGGGGQSGSGGGGGGGRGSWGGEGYPP